MSLTHDDAENETLVNEGSASDDDVRGARETATHDAGEEP